MHKDGRDGYVMVYALRAALAVTAPPEQKLLRDIFTDTEQHDA